MEKKRADAKISLKFSLPMHVLYKLSLSSFIFIFISYLFLNGSQTIGALYLAYFLCSAMTFLNGLLVIDNLV